MSTAKKYVNEPITYSPDDKLPETKLFQEIGKALKAVQQSRRKTGLSGIQKIFREKKLK